MQTLSLPVPSSSFSQPWAYRFRDLLAALPSAALVLALVGFGFQQATSVAPSYDDQPVAVSLVTVEDPPPAPQPEPQPAPAQPAPAQPQPPQPQVIASQTAQPTTNPVPVTETPPPPKAAEPVRQAETAKPAEPQPTRPSSASAESEYVARVRSHLNSIKRYPTGREASQQRPQGKVRVWFVLRRDGALADSGIEESSNSMLLDEAARKTLNRASFPAFPDAVWPGEASHRFTAELEFLPPA